MVTEKIVIRYLFGYKSIIKWSNVDAIVVGGGSSIAGHGRAPSIIIKTINKPEGKQSFFTGTKLPLSRKIIKQIYKYQTDSFISL